MELAGSRKREAVTSRTAQGRLGARYARGEGRRLALAFRCPHQDESSLFSALEVIIHLGRGGANRLRKKSKYRVVCRYRCCQRCIIGVEQAYAHNGGNLEEGSDGAGRVAFFDALQQAARNTGAVCQFLRGEFAPDPSAPDQLAKN